MAKIEDFPMWSVKEVAFYFRISEATVWDMARIPAEKGGPPVCRLGRIIRFPTQEFLAWCKTAKRFKSIRKTYRKKKSHVLHDNRIQRNARAVDVAV
jgi:hypothetical protein